MKLYQVKKQYQLLNEAIRESSSLFRFLGINELIPLVEQNILGYTEADTEYARINYVRNNDNNHNHYDDDDMPGYLRPYDNDDDETENPTSVFVKNFMKQAYEKKAKKAKGANYFDDAVSLFKTVANKNDGIVDDTSLANPIILNKRKEYNYYKSFTRTLNPHLVMGFFDPANTAIVEFDRDKIAKIPSTKLEEVVSEPNVRTHDTDEMESRSFSKVQNNKLLPGTVKKIAISPWMLDKNEDIIDILEANKSPYSILPKFESSSLEETQEAYIRYINQHNFDRLNLKRKRFDRHYQKSII